MADKTDVEVGATETEVDPCLPLTAAAPDPLPNTNTPKKKLTLTDKQNGRAVWPDSELEGMMRKKYGVNREGFLLSVVSWILLLLLLVIILVMIVLWPRSTHTGQLCTKAACFRASASILPSMERDRDRCSDLYGYACGGWSAMHPKPPPTRQRWDQKTELRLRLAENVRDLVATLPHPTRTTSTTWKMKHFYESCMALDNIATDNKRPLMRIISGLGGWNVLREFSILAWDASQAFVQLQAEYGVNPFFTVSVVDHPFLPNTSIIEIAPPTLELPRAHYYEHKEEKIATSYREFMRDVVTVFGATSVESNLFANEMFYFERSLAEGLPPITELSDSRTHQMVNVSHLKMIAQSLPVFEILRALLPNENIVENTPILVQSVKYLEALSRIFGTVDRGALNNYIIWNLVKTYLPYLGEDLQKLHSVYLRNTKGILEPLERWEFCADSLLRFQGVALTARLQNNQNRRDEVLGEVFENLKWAVKDSVTKAEWIDLELYQHIVKKLDGMKMISSLGDKQTSDLFLDDFYAQLLVQKNDFFKNIWYGVEFLKYQLSQKYKRVDPSYQWIDKITDAEVSYLPSANSVIIGHGLLREPWFHPDYPAGLLYGGIGAEIAAVILSAILPPYGLYSHNGTLLPPTGLVANLSRSSIDRQLACLMGNSSVQGLSTFLSISGLRQSLKALKRVVSKNEFTVQPGMENLTEGELLILRYTQSQCIIQTSQDEILDIAVTAPLRGSNLIIEVMKNLKTATDILSCSAPTAPCKHLL